jgi:NADH-quinone oxidoreductase subunit G
VAARAALAAAGFVLSLEVRAGSVTEYADVVLPVAPPPEKAGTFLNWEGRWRDFPKTLAGNALTDGQVLDSVASRSGHRLGLRDARAAYSELAELGGWEGTRATAPDEPAANPSPGLGIVADQIVTDQIVTDQIVTDQRIRLLLSTWSLLLDKGRLQDGEPYLAGTAHRAVARLSPATATSLGLLTGAAGRAVTVSTDRGEITLPLAVTPMPDGVVWLPANSTGSSVRGTLGVGSGDPVTVRPAAAAVTW